MISFLKAPTTFARLFFCNALGLLAAFSMGPFYIWPAMAVSLSLFWVTLTSFANDKPWKSALAGFLYGFGFFAGSLWWIGNALLVGGTPYKWVYPLAVCGLPALLSLFPMLAALGLRKLASGRSLTAYMAFLALYFVSEMARGHLFTGFPWNLTGMAWTNNLNILQFLSIGGVYSLTAISIFIFSIWGFIWKGDAARWQRNGLGCLAIIICISLSVYGGTRLQRNPTQFNPDVVVQMIQPNIAQEDKWDGAKIWDNYRDLLNLMKEDSSSKYQTPPKTRLVVMPETALTYHELNTLQARDALAGRLSGYTEPNVYLLTGALLHDDAGYHNSLIAMDRQGHLLKTFDKFHLVPFGEYMPLNKYTGLGSIVGFEGFVEGDGPHSITLPDAPAFSPLVCYEVIFAGHVISKAEPRPEWLLNVTNDAWYGISPGPFQHLAQARYRAIEEGLPIVRVANTGISATFDAYGRQVGATGLFHEAAPEILLPRPANIQPIYSKLFN